MPAITQALAEYAASTTYESLPPGVVSAVKHLIIDSLGTALAAGTLSDGCRELVDMAASCGGEPHATMLGFAKKGPAPLAALVNGGLVHGLNYDAGGPGHLGVVALVAPLAAAEYAGGVCGQELITASATACEITARMSLAAHGADLHGELPWLAGQFMGYVGAAVGAGRVMHLSESEMLSAIALAAMQAAGIRQVVLDGDPPAKAIYGAFPNQGGVQAALLSRFGLRADCAAIEGSGGFYAAFFGESGRAARLADDLGRTFLMEGVRYKAWPTSGNVAPYIEAALQVREDHRLTADRITRVQFTGGERIRHWCEPVEERSTPSSPANAANSIFFGIANALAYGEVTLQQFTPAGFADPTVVDVARKSDFVIVDDAASASLTVWTVDGAEIRAPVAPSASPVTEDQLVAKFRDCARYSPQPLPAEAVQRIVDQVLGLEDVADVRAIVARL
jgi:2-methylcitrate dehydratase PrpD